MSAAFDESEADSSVDTIPDPESGVILQIRDPMTLRVPASEASLVGPRVVGLCLCSSTNHYCSACKRRSCNLCCSDAEDPLARLCPNCQVAISAPPANPLDAINSQIRASFGFKEDQVRRGVHRKSRPENWEQGGSTSGEDDPPAPKRGKHNGAELFIAPGLQYKTVVVDTFLEEMMSSQKRKDKVGKPAVVRLVRQKHPGAWSGTSEPAAAKLVMSIINRSIIQYLKKYGPQGIGGSGMTGPEPSEHEDNIRRIIELDRNLLVSPPALPRRKKTRTGLQDLDAEEVGEDNSTGLQDLYVEGAEEDYGTGGQVSGRLNLTREKVPVVVKSNFGRKEEMEKAVQLKKDKARRKEEGTHLRLKSLLEMKVERQSAPRAIAALEMGKALALKSSYSESKTQKKEVIEKYREDKEDLRRDRKRQDREEREEDRRRIQAMEDRRIEAMEDRRERKDREERDRLNRIEDERERRNREDRQRSIKMEDERDASRMGISMAIIQRLTAQQTQLPATAVSSTVQSPARTVKIYRSHEPDGLPPLKLNLSIGIEKFIRDLAEYADVPANSVSLITSDIDGDEVVSKSLEDVNPGKYDLTVVTKDTKTFLKLVEIVET